ncbi:MAG: hypothetical protein AAGI24_03525 [Pseudomonadota bacterium]
MSNVELTVGARAAIRSYLFKIVALPSFVVAAFGGITGFMIVEVAMQHARNNAYSEAQDFILAVVKDVTQAREEARYSADEVDRLLNEARALAIEAEEIRAKITLAEAFQKSDDLVQEVADVVTSEQNVEELLAKKLDARIRKLEERTNEVRKAAIYKDEQIRLEASNFPGEFVRHLNYSVRIGGDRNSAYDGDRTWIIRKRD